MKRKIVQIATAATHGKVRLFALAADGTLWYVDTGEHVWRPVVDLPQS